MPLHDHETDDAHAQLAGCSNDSDTMATPASAEPGLMLGVGGEAVDIRMQP